MCAVSSEGGSGSFPNPYSNIKDKKFCKVCLFQRFQGRNKVEDSLKVRCLTLKEFQVSEFLAFTSDLNVTL